MSTREIVSLQFGHYSNFAGTHWWNLQETGFDYSDQTLSEINHDVLFREGLTNKGEVTFTPRLLLLDLKGSLKALPELGELYNSTSEPKKSAALWPDNAVEVISEEKSLKNTFQQALASESDPLSVISEPNENLNNEVHVWSDFLYSRYHPRSINLIKEYRHGDTEAPFDAFPAGSNLWRVSDYCDGFADKIRNYMEECDNPQGFHVTVDAVDGFGGLAASCLEYLGDEYDKKGVLTFATVPSYYSDYDYSSAEQREESTKKDSIRLVNLALSLEKLSEFSGLVVPLCTGSKGWRQPGPKREFNHVNYKPELYYHSSAILASAVDTFTLPYRLKNNQFSVGDFCSGLNNYGRKIAAASVCLPFSMNAGADLIDCLDNWEGPLWQNLTPNCNIGTDKLIQIVTARGISESRLKRAQHEAKKQREMPAYRCESVQEMLSFYLSCTSFATASHVSTVKEPLSVRTPFPGIFDKNVGTTGDIMALPRQSSQGVKTVPVLAACHSGSEIGNMLETLHREASRIKIARFQQFKTASFESDDYKDGMDRLLDLRECYEESFE